MVPTESGYSQQSNDQLCQSYHYKTLKQLPTTYYQKTEKIIITSTVMIPMSSSTTSSTHAIQNKIHLPRIPIIFIDTTPNHPWCVLAKKQYNDKGVDNVTLQNTTLCLLLGISNQVHTKVPAYLHYFIHYT